MRQKALLLLATLLLTLACLGTPQATALPESLTEAITPHSLRWINAEYFLFFREGNLLIGQTKKPRNDFQRIRVLQSGGSSFV